MHHLTAFVYEYVLVITATDLLHYVLCNLSQSLEGLGELNLCGGRTTTSELTYTQLLFFFYQGKKPDSLLLIDRYLIFREVNSAVFHSSSILH